MLENCAAGDLYHIVQDSGPIWEEGWLVSQVNATLHSHFFLGRLVYADCVPVWGGKRKGGSCVCVCVCVCVCACVCVYVCVCVCGRDEWLASKSGGCLA